MLSFIILALVASVECQYYGFNVRSTADLAATAALGAKTARIEFFTSVISPNKGEWNWGPTDAMMQQAATSGVKINGVLAYGSPWLCGKDWSNWVYNDIVTDLAGFGMVAAAAAERYKDQLYMMEIWNEANSAGYWGNQTPDPQGYVNLLAAAYTEIKKVAPKVLVSTAGTAGIQGPGKPDTWIILQINSYNLLSFCDVIALHPYTGGRTPVTDPAITEWSDIARVEAAIAAKGGNQKIALTELGCSTAPGLQGVYQVTSEDQQANLYTSYCDAIKTDKNIIAVHFYDYRDDGTNVNDMESYFGVISKDGSHIKPAVNSFKTCCAQADDRSSTPTTPTTPAPTTPTPNNPPPAPTPTNNGVDYFVSIKSFATFSENSRLWDANKNYAMVLQIDGNLVIYTKDGNPIWALGTSDGVGIGLKGYMMNIQGDANLVVYRNVQPVKVVWASMTIRPDTDGPFTLTMQTTGNLVWTDKNNNQLWASNSTQLSNSSPPPSDFNNGTVGTPRPDYSNVTIQQPDNQVSESSLIGSNIVMIVTFAIALLAATF